MLVICLLGGLLFEYVLPRGMVLWQRSFSGKATIDEARASSFFPLPTESWLSFDIPGGAELFRFYAHAALPTDLGMELVSYAVDYQWLDKRGDILEENRHHVTTRLSSAQLSGAEGGGAALPQNTRFFARKDLLPSREQALYFKTAQQPEASLLRLRVTDKDPRIAQIGVRPFQQHLRSRESVDVAWQRLSDGKRELLSKGALYPSFLLSEYERKNLLSRYWKPIGPLGVLNTDYNIDTLYQLDSDAPALPPATPASDGLFAGPQHWVTMLLHDPAGRYRMEWQALPGSEAPGKLWFLWQSADAQQQREWHAKTDGLAWEGELEAGLLQVTPDQGGVMKLYLLSGSEWLDITPERRYSRTFLCSPEAPLRYSLAPGAEAQPLKIDARAFSREGQPPPAGNKQVSLQLLNDHASVLYQHSLDLPGRSYPYQHFIDAARLPSQVFEPVSSYMVASPDANSLHLECTVPSLVSVYSRPWRHPTQRELPAQESYWYSWEKREPVWFSLQPDNARALVRQKRYHSLVWYFRPRDLRTGVATGNYSWQFLVADDPEAVELQVFTPHHSKNLSRIDSRASAFKPIDSATELNIAGSSNEKTLTPGIVYVRDSAEPQAIEVWIDDELALQTSIAGNAGKLRLPPMHRGRHHLKIKPGGMGWYVNHTAGNGQTHLLRAAWSLTPRADGGAYVDFPLDTSGDSQQLGLWLYTPDGSQPVNCELELTARRYAGVRHDHTLFNHRYRLDSTDMDVSYVLQRRQARVRGPARLVIPLDKDLPAQMARARLSCDQQGVLASAGLVSEGLSTFRYFEERYAFD